MLYKICKLLNTFYTLCKITMRERLKDLNVRITELSEYLDLSRPTLYKFIDLYDKRKYKNINKRVLKLFKYIDETPNIGKANVVAYILNNPDITSKDNEDDDSIANIFAAHRLSLEHSPEKTEFIKNILEYDLLDDAIPYLNHCFSIYQNEKYSNEDYKSLSKLILFKEDVSKGRSPTQFKIEKTIELLRSVN